VQNVGFDLVGACLTDSEFPIANALQGGAYLALEALVTTLHAVGPLPGAPRSGKIGFVFGIAVVIVISELSSPLSSLPDS